MNISRYIFCAALLAALAMFANEAQAQSQSPDPAPVLAQASCARAVAQAERQTGGRVIGSPRTVNQGGQTICVIQLLVPDPRGVQPPMRQTVRIPAS
ncbi:MAG: hypothetical protein AAFX39_06200 [Pseudomonadota bacterium]